MTCFSLCPYAGSQIPTLAPLRFIDSSWRGALPLHPVSWYPATQPSARQAFWDVRILLRFLSEREMLYESGPFPISARRDLPGSAATVGACREQQEEDTTLKAAV